MPRYKSTFDSIGENLLQKNSLYEVVQQKIDEKKPKEQIIKEIELEFLVTPLQISEIEEVFSRSMTPDNCGEYEELITAPIALIYPLFERIKDKNPYWDIKIVEDDFIDGQYRIEGREGLSPWIESEVEEVLASIKQGDIQKVSIIKKTRNKNEWCVYSKKSNRNMGCYDSIAGAKNRLKEIETFKHINGATERQAQDFGTEFSMAEHWLDRAKPGDKLQLETGELAEIVSISPDKLEVKTPRKTEVIWRRRSDKALIGREIETNSDMLVIVDIFEIKIPKRTNGIITKLVDNKLDEVVAQFDIDDIEISIINGEERTEDIGAFEGKFGHYFEMSLKDNQYVFIREEAILADGVVI